jgi:hypothetical protein
MNEASLQTVRSQQTGLKAQYSQEADVLLKDKKHFGKFSNEKSAEL